MTVTFTDLLDQLGEKSKRAAQQVAQDYLDGKMTGIHGASNALAMVLRTANLEGVVLGQAACREILETMGDSGAYTAAPAATAHYEDAARLATAANTALSVQETAVMAAGRLALAEAVEAAQAAFGSTLQQSPKVTGWTRGMEADACQLCTWWWREGRVWPKDYTIQTHKGCTCRQVPTTISITEFETVSDKAWRGSEARREQKETSK